MNTGRMIVLLVVMLGVGACATTQRDSKAFDVSRVTLYDCGLAQMERVAQVSGAVQLEIRLRLAHLDDMLATLVVASKGGVQVSGVRYPSVFTLGQARAASSFANAAGDTEGLEERPGSPLCHYMLALVGTPVKAVGKDNRVVEGTVLDCVHGKAEVGEDGESSYSEESLLLVGADGTVAWMALDQVRELVPRSAGEGEAMNTYARQLGRAPGLGETSVRIQTAPGSNGKLAAGYIRQAPVWRMSYKVTARKDGISLEAWGVVHNDSDEDWKDIGLTLVSGLPESYVLSVASPRYAQREALYTDEGHNMFPQLGAATPDSLLYEESVVRYEYAGGVSLGARGMGGGGGMAYGSVSGRAGHVSRSVSGSQAGDSSLLEVGKAAAVEQTQPAVEEEISTYSALTAVSVPARTSSMVPLMRRDLPGQAFSLVDETLAPRTCVHVRNETGLVLQYGASSFYVNGRFRGQTEFPRTEPGDIRVLCFGEDADVQVALDRKEERSLKALEWRSGALYVHELVNTNKVFTLDNRAGQARQMAIKVTHRHNGRIVSPSDTLAGEGAERYVLVDAPARKKIDQVVQVEEGVERNIPQTLSQLTVLHDKAGLPDDVRTVLARAITVLREDELLVKKSNDLSSLLQKAQEALARQQSTLKDLPEAAAATAAAAKMVEQLRRTEQTIEKLITQLDEVQQARAALALKVTDTLSTLPSPRR